MWWNERTVLEKVQIGIGVVGVVLLIGGLVVAFKGSSKNSGVEIVSESMLQEASSSAQIVVDVSGAVQRPGVYKLNQNLRVNDALVAAGGLASDADRVWLARYLNLAQVVPDGAKIYIPYEGESGNTSKVSSIGTTGKVSGVSIGSVLERGVNINTASQQELDGLWGIGEKRAGDIIANRPYQNTEELMTKAGIPKNVYEKIKDKIVIY